jgi:thiamine pyrophosphate-dependent acetolactate synthase large subunit-like protein
MRKEGAAMAQLVADYVLGRLREWGVRRIYGYPGDGINAFLGAFDRAGGDLSSSRRDMRRWRHS